MMWFKKKHRTILVLVYKDNETKPFIQTVVPIEELPDTFEVSTTLNFEGEEWSIAEAKLATKEECRRLGYVQVAVYKPRVEYVPIDKLLYTVPTINDHIPAVEHSSTLENVFVVREDDWRQTEIISRDYLDQIAKEMQSIRQIYDRESDGVGFNKVHLRSEILAPLQGARLSLPKLMTTLRCSHLFRGVAFDASAAVITNGFAFRNATGCVLWGRRGKEIFYSSFVSTRPRPFLTRQIHH